MRACVRCGRCGGIHITDRSRLLGKAAQQPLSYFCRKPLREGWPAQAKSGFLHYPDNRSSRSQPAGTVFTLRKTQKPLDIGRQTLHGVLPLGSAAPSSAAPLLGALPQLARRPLIAGAERGGLCECHRITQFESRAGDDQCRCGMAFPGRALLRRSQGFPSQTARHRHLHMAEFRLDPCDQDGKDDARVEHQARASLTTLPSGGSTMPSTCAAQRRSAARFSSR